MSRFDKTRVINAEIARIEAEAGKAVLEARLAAMQAPPTPAPAAPPPPPPPPVQPTHYEIHQRLKESNPYLAANYMLQFSREIVAEAEARRGSAQ
jgi:hypothetical protein